MMRYSLLFFFIHYFAFPIFSQNQAKPNPKIDSLQRLIEKANDTTKVNLMNELCRLYAKNDLKQAIQYAELSLEISQKSNYKKGEAQALTALGVFIRRRGNEGDIDKAFEYHSKALDIRKKINDKQGLGMSLSNIGTIYQNKSDFPNAQEALLASLKFLEDVKDNKGVLSTLNNLGTMYMRQADEQSHNKVIYHKAVEYFEKGLILAKKLKDKQNEAILLNNIGSVYEQTDEYLKAIENYHKARQIREDIHDNFQLTSSFHSLGDVYLAMDSIKIATNYYEKGIMYGEKSQNKLVTGQCIYGLARIHEKRKEYEACLLKAQKSLEIAEKVQDDKSIINNKLLLAKVYAIKGDFAKAYQYKEEATALKEKISSEEIAKILANNQANAEKERNEKEKERRAKEQEVKDARQRLFNYLGLAIIVFIAGVAFLLFRGQQREKKHSKEIALEKDKSDKLLLNILPEEVASELKAQGKAKARHYRMASVLFTDFQGFTARTASMTPEQVIEELNGCFSAFDAIIDKHGLEKIKTIGDAYMCAGGLPVANETNPIDIIRAGIEIQAYMKQYREECIARGEAYFQCRLGINTGEVVAGVVGTSKFAYDIWGDTVNTASRAESGGIVNMVNITEATYQLVKGVFECEYRGEVEAKGKGKIGMYLVLGEKNT